MNKKSKARFLKRIMVYSLVMATIVTLAALGICWRTGEITGAVVTALCSLWSIELALGAWIKITEGKAEKNTKDKGGSI